MHLARQTASGYRERVSPFAHSALTDNAPAAVENQVRRRYLRFRVRDQPGIIAALAGILSDSKISVDAVLQEPALDHGDLPFVITLEPTAEGALRKALERMKALSFLVDEPLALPLEPGLEAAAGQN
jgi:homoserine dehydrogenase